MEQKLKPQHGVAKCIVAFWNRLVKPRSMLRLIQLICAIVVITNVVNFSTKTTFDMSCYNTSYTYDFSRRHSTYIVDYPFDLSATSLSYVKNCTGGVEMTTQTFDIDYSSSARFFVLTGVIASLFAVAVEFVYVLHWRTYENNGFLALADLGGTAGLTILWLVGAISWAFAVIDIKHYANPRHLTQQLANCNTNIGHFRYSCWPMVTGKWSPLYVSLIAGFGSFFFWMSSTWYAYKGVNFRRQTVQDQPAYLSVSSGSTGTSGDCQTSSTVGV